MPPRNDDKPFDVQYKIVLVGDAGVGKTNILGFYSSRVSEGGRLRSRTRSASNESNRQSKSNSVPSFSNACKPTVGVEFATKIIVHPKNGARIKAQIWDTAGQERYRAITTSHYRRAAGAFLVYDVSASSSFKSLKRWVDLLEQSSSSSSGSNLLKCVTVVGNKIDLCEKQTTIDASEQDSVVYDLFSSAGVSVRTSAKTGEGIIDAFEKLVVRVYDLDKSNNTRSPPPPTTTIKLGNSSSNNSSSSSCC
ncbi:hypothetical protein ScalyP_jg7494 [Parmales sp. scaly parma]|nr:hypothetical protein ScalyP_jg7494 [Parmales sp. scaly parma]